MSVDIQNACMKHVCQQFVPLLFRKFVQADNNENIKAPR